MRNVVLLCGLLLCLALPAQATAPNHPADGCVINEWLFELLKTRQFTPASWSYGEMQFFGPEFSVPIEELTHAEKYMLVGASASNINQGGALDSWSGQIQAFCWKYYNRHGSLPAALNEEIVRGELPPGGHSDPRYIDLYRNPITGEWPRLDAREFSPGDAFIRPLTPAEIDHLCAQSSLDRLLLKEHKDINPETNQLEPVKLLTPPFYVRIYGERAPIVAMIQVMRSFE